MQEFINFCQYVLSLNFFFLSLGVFSEILLIVFQGGFIFTLSEFTEVLTLG